MILHPDFRDLLAAFAAGNVRYLVIGGYAVGFHDRPRYTKDIDLIATKRAANRDKDQLDAKHLERVRARRDS